MPSTKRMTKLQQREAYREAVRFTLVGFYDTPAPVAEKKVSEWWARLSTTGAFRSGLFMHSEPMNTAGILADKQVIDITPEVWPKYARLLDESREIALHDRTVHSVKSGVATRSTSRAPEGLKSLPSVKKNRLTSRS